jgi:aspartate carbamoyltransferase catalytic subunit
MTSPNRSPKKSAALAGPVLRPAEQQAKRHIVSINDLTNDEIEGIFREADRFLEKLGDPVFPYRIARTTDGGRGRILASLFYEPSTRTRLSFESAMQRLGGSTIASADPATSSAAKGESLADSVRVTANYADIIVIRHPRDGAAKLAAEYSPVPIINGGDGSHEHPTQTLCDLYTLRRENKNIRKLNVAISGDLKGSRTIHSFVYALARFGANIIPMPARGMELPSHVGQRLLDEFRCVIAPKSELGANDAAIDALYVTPDEPHQLSLYPDSQMNVPINLAHKKIDVVYVTRFQKERWQDKDQPYPRVDANFLSGNMYSETRVLHPLPRVGELDAALDNDRRAVYFQQAAYGVPVRMALISLILGLSGGHKLQTFENGFRQLEEPLYDRPPGEGMQCVNRNCIVHDPAEAQYTRNKFLLLSSRLSPVARARCFYCETDVGELVVADRRSKHYSADEKPSYEDVRKKLGDVVFFSSPAEAQSRGYSPSARRARRPEGS